MIEYRAVEGFPGYQVSSDGKLWSTLKRMPLWDQKTGQIRGMRWVKGGPPHEIGTTSVSMGYLRTRLHREGKRDNKFVHNLVCEAFHGLRPGPYPQWHACHKNGDPLDNRAENLKWATVQENMADQYKHGTRQRGVGHHSAKLTEEQVHYIRQSTKLGTELAAELGVSKHTVYQVIRGTTWKHLK